jgi:surface protein
MKKTHEIKKLLILNYNLKTNRCDYFPKTNDELEYLINNMINKFGNEVDLNDICVSNINYFKSIFFWKNFFNGDVSEWDVSRGLNFESMFYGCEVFNSDLSKWDVSNGKYFMCMFLGCKRFNFDLKDLDVSKGKYFDYMFYSCDSFDSDLSGWNVSNAWGWPSFAKGSLLEEYPERIPEKFRSDYL